MATIHTTYAQPADLAARLTLKGSASSEPLLQSYLDAAAEQVDALTRGYRPGVDGNGNRYEAFSSVTETRVFDDDYSGVVLVDDLLAITALLRGTVTITSDYYKLDPPNRLPAERVLLRADATIALTVDSLWYGFPFVGKGVGQVSITGDFGFCPATHRPAVVKEATLRLAAWAYSQEGVTPKDKMAALRDPTKPFYWEVEGLLRPLKRGSGVRFG